MKPNNISDVLENISNLSREVLIDTEARNQILRSQIEKLLGRIDTEKKKINPGSVNGDLQVKKTGYNQKSSETANQIKLMIK